MKGAADRISAEISRLLGDDGEGEPVEALGSEPLMAAATLFEAAQAQTLLGEVSRHTNAKAPLLRRLPTSAVGAKAPCNARTAVLALPLSRGRRA